MTREWAVVIRGDWYLPHLVNMLDAYRGNGEQNLCRDEVVGQVEAQMVPLAGDSVEMTTRPLVVIDPEDREQVEALADIFCAIPSSGWVDQMQAALRSLADPPSPRPDEPQGLGAVVEDDDGDLWVRLETGAWAYGGNAGGCVMWPELSVARVLSPGYDPEATS